MPVFIRNEGKMTVFGKNKNKVPVSKKIKANIRLLDLTLVQVVIKHIIIRYN